MFGSGRVRRFTQDTPVLPDVWLEYALDPKDFANRLTQRDTDDPHARVNLLLTPFREKAAGRVAEEVRLRVEKYRSTGGFKHAKIKPARIIYNQSTVGA